MEILNRILNRISGRLEQQVDLQITNKTVIVFTLSLISFIVFLAYGVIKSIQGITFISGVLLVSSFLALCNVFILSFTRKYRLCGILITGLIGCIFLLILLIGNNLAFELYWGGLFPLIILPIYGLRRGPVATLIYIGLGISVFVFSS